jgi:hypothetical protein
MHLISFSWGEDVRAWGTAHPMKSRGKASRLRSRVLQAIGLFGVLAFVISVRPWTMRDSKTVTAGEPVTRARAC